MMIWVLQRQDETKQIVIKDGSISFVGDVKLRHMLGALISGP